MKIETKNGKIVFLLWFFYCLYGRFLSSKIASKAPTMAIATIMPATAGTKYMSATDCRVGVGVAVAAGAAVAKKDISAEDGQYEFEPAKEAMTVYEPVMSGVQAKVTYSIH